MRGVRDDDEMDGKDKDRNESWAYHQLLTLLETPQEGSEGADVHGVGQDGHEMVQDPGNLAKQGSDPLCSLGDLNVQQLLDGQGVDLLVGHHGHIVETVKVWQGLQVRLVLDQLLGATVQQTDVGVGANNLFTIELEDETQDTVGGRVLGTKVDSVMSDLA